MRLRRLRLLYRAASITVAPAISADAAIIGTPTVGVATSYTPATVTGTPSPTLTQIQWTLDGSPIVGANSATYTPVGGDATHALAVQETWTNSAGSVVSTSSSQTVAAAAVAPAITVDAAIIGTPTVGVASSYTPATATGSPAPTVSARQWTLDGVDIGGATGTTYTPISGDATHALRIKETWTNASGSAVSTSAPQTVVVNAGTGTATINWSASADASGITGYNLYYQVDPADPYDGPWTLAGNVGPSTFTYTYNGLANGVLHRLLIRAVTAVGETPIAPPTEFTPA